MCKGSASTNRLFLPSFSGYQRRRDTGGRRLEMSPSPEQEELREPWLSARGRASAAGHGSSKPLTSKKMPLCAKEQF